MSVGIDAISFYSSHYFLDMRTLATARGVDPEKYSAGLGQERMAVLPPDEDVITMAATAASFAVSRYRKDEFDFVIFTTESGVDQSKSGAIYVRSMLGLARETRVIEMKQACYSSTAALQLALPYVETHPTRKVLIVASDVARYGLNTSGEPTQGCGAVAIVVSASPRLIEFDGISGCVTDDVMDFWRPNYMREALVDGKYSSKLYLHALDETWEKYSKLSGRGLRDHARFCYHLPFTRMAEKAHQRLCSAHYGNELSKSQLEEQIGDSLRYNRVTGNSYSASLYVGLTSLLDNSKEDLGEKRIGLFSYGSGCSAEYFSGLVKPGYKDWLFTQNHRELLEGRTELSYEQYQEFFSFTLPTDGREYEVGKYKTGPFRFRGLNRHKRKYETVSVGYATSNTSPS